MDNFLRHFNESNATLEFRPFVDEDGKATIMFEDRYSNEYEFFEFDQQDLQMLIEWAANLKKMIIEENKKGSVETDPAN